MNRSMSKETFIEKACKIHGNSFDYTNTIYNSSEYYIKIVCNTCKTIIKLIASNHLYCSKAGNGCKTCSFNKQRKTTEEFIEESIKIHGNKYDYSESIYLNAKTKIKILCKLCKSYFDIKPPQHTSAKHGCPKCKLSHGESKVSQVLEKFDINYKPQKTFPECVGKINLLKFDFYLPDYNLCIEYDGKQHFDKKSKFWSQSNIDNDNIKNKFCFDNNIKLLRIHFMDYSRIEEILINFLDRTGNAK